MPLMGELRHYVISNELCSTVYCDSEQLLAAIKSAVKTACHDCQVVFVDGLPGAGKSTLLESLNADLSPDYCCVDEHPLIRHLLIKEKADRPTRTLESDWMEACVKLDEIQATHMAGSVQLRPGATTLYLCRDLYTAWTFAKADSDRLWPRMSNLNDAMWLDGLTHTAKVAYLYLDVPWSILLGRWEAGADRGHERESLAAGPDYYDAVGERMYIKWKNLEHYEYKVHIRVDERPSYGWDEREAQIEDEDNPLPLRVTGVGYTALMNNRRCPDTMNACIPYSTIRRLGVCKPLEVRLRGLAAIGDDFFGRLSKRGKYEEVGGGAERGVVVDEGPKMKYARLHGEAQVDLVRATEHSAGYDLYSCEDAVVGGGKREVIDTGLAVELPPGTYGQLLTKSGMAKRYLSVCGGVIDCDYRGSIKVVLQNDAPENCLIAPGDPVAQLVIIPIKTPATIEAPKLSETVRGSSGFGSTSRVDASVAPDDVDDVSEDTLIELA